MSRRLQSVKSRELIFSERDEIAFGRILRERYPTVRYVQEKRYWTDDIPVFNNIAECPEGLLEVFVPDENWRPLILSYPNKSTKTEYYLHTRPPQFRYFRSKWLWPGIIRKFAFDPPTLESGHVEGAFYRENDEEQRLFLVAVWRLITKISMCIGDRWCGYDAMREALSRPRGMLDGCIRPPEDWVFPEDNPYYNDDLWDDSVEDHPGLRVMGAPALWRDDD